MVGNVHINQTHNRGYDNLGHSGLHKLSQGSFTLPLERTSKAKQAKETSKAKNKRNQTSLIYFFIQSKINDCTVIFFFLFCFSMFICSIIMSYNLVFTRVENSAPNALHLAGSLSVIHTLVCFYKYIF